MKPHLIGAVFATISSVATSLSAAVYDCDVTAPSGSWVMPQVIIEHAPGSDKVMVLDGVIQEFVGKPLEGFVTSDDAQRLKVAWVVRGTKDGRNNFA